MGSGRRCCCSSSWRPCLLRREAAQGEREGRRDPLIDGELAKSGNQSDVYVIEEPLFGNHVDEKLFSGEVDVEPFSPARLWRTSPNVFESIKSATAATPPTSAAVPAGGQMGIRDYADLLFADSAAGQQRRGCGRRPHREAVCRPRRVDEIPDEANVALILRDRFQAVVYRAPRREEDHYSFQEVAQRAAPPGAPGRPDGRHAAPRVRLPTGDRARWAARGGGCSRAPSSPSPSPTRSPTGAPGLDAGRPRRGLGTRVVKREVERILADRRIKPRTLRFFQEFFGTPRPTRSSRTRSAQDSPTTARTTPRCTSARRTSSC